MKRVVSLAAVGLALVATPLMGKGPSELAERQLMLAGKKLHYLESGPARGRTVLLLHGGRFSSETWRKLGTIERLAEAGYHVVALDLPGFGLSEATPLDRERVLVEVLDNLSIDEAVVVSPSMSGQFSFPLVTEHPDRVSGFVPVAPAGIDRYVEALRRVRVPALIIWGEKDAVIPLEKSVTLVAALSDSRRVVLEGASHPCYLDRPDEFHRALLDFIGSLGSR